MCFTYPKFQSTYFMPDSLILDVEINALINVNPKASCNEMKRKMSSIKMKHENSALRFIRLRINFSSFHFKIHTNF